MSASTPGAEPEGEGGAVLALVPAKDEAERVGATVLALRALPGVAEVLVVSDGSTDATAARALEAGAHCLDLPRNIGKGGALNAGLAALMGRVAERLSPEPAALLLADADLAETAGRLDHLLDPVLAGEADLAIADLPAQQGAGGFGVAMALARRGMARATGRRMAEPLSGQRAVRWEALPALLPFAPGFGVEVAMTMDALRAGLRVVEVEVDLRHNATGKDLSGLLHRARQARAIARELSRRKAWRPTPNGAEAPDDKDPADKAPGNKDPGGWAPDREGSRGGRESGGEFPQPPGEPRPPGEPQPPDE
ncbi:MAG TPA: glycosyltransferase, partial [Actinomycetes bacterium]|nr:glycosyltransferase [Actinomycetes bacterium]